MATVVMPPPDPAGATPGANASTAADPSRGTGVEQAAPLARPVAEHSNAQSRRFIRDATPQEIIASARSAPAPARAALAASGLTAALLWAAFTPVDFGPLGWICLVPLLALARVARPTRLMYASLYLGGLAFWVPTLQWMRLGDPAMYIAWVALAVYLAAYFPLFIALTRVAVWRFSVPLMAAAPVVWVGLELLRGHLFTGFSWYMLGHTQYRWIELIQVSDLVGAYGVSFLLVLSAACLTELLPQAWLARCRLLPAMTSLEKLPESPLRAHVWRVSAALLVFSAVLGYGYWRRDAAEFTAGPRVAAVQGNVPTSLKHDPRDWPRIQRQHEILTGKAVLQQPDLIVWPETMFRWPLFETPDGLTDAELQAAHPHLPVEWLRELPVRKKMADMSQMAGAALMIGVETIQADRASTATYNSAVFVRPETGVVGRYDKLHRVIFGEYIPLADEFPLLRKLTPFPEGFGLQAGKQSAAFEVRGARFAPIICFEDTVPHLVRDIIRSTTADTPQGPRQVDFLVNLTNDGWFHGSSELDQHLITAAFRSVECRKPMVRAVNTGISAFIDGDGVIRQRAFDIETGRAKQVEAVVVDTIPLDNRTSLYVAGGDWFAGGCLACCLFLAMAALLPRWFPQRPAVELA